MSAGLCYPIVVRAPAPTGGPTIVRVPAPVTPSVVRQEIPGIPGPPGAEGPPGPSYGFGSVTYGHLIADPTSTDPAVMGTPIAANVPWTIAFAADPAPLSYSHLNAPFSGLVLWDGAKVVGRAYADRLEVQVNLIVRSQRAGGSITLEVSAGVSAVPITADNKNLIKPAGISERVTLNVRFETLDGVMANGAKLVLTSTVDGAVFRESVIVAPVSILATAS